MKVLSEKKTICTSIKVLYENNDNRWEDEEQKKKEGWKIAKKPNWYTEGMIEVHKVASNGIVVTYIRYDKIES